MHVRLSAIKNGCYNPDGTNKVITMPEVRVTTNQENVLAFGDLKLVVSLGIKEDNQVTLEICKNNEDRERLTAVLTGTKKTDLTIQGHIIGYSNRNTYGGGVLFELKEYALGPIVPDPDADGVGRIDAQDPYIMFNFKRCTGDKGKITSEIVAWNAPDRPSRIVRFDGVGIPIPGHPANQGMPSGRFINGAAGGAAAYGMGGFPNSAPKGRINYDDDPNDPELQQALMLSLAQNQQANKRQHQAEFQDGGEERKAKVQVIEKIVDLAREFFSPDTQGYRPAPNTRPSARIELIDDDNTSGPDPRSISAAFRQTFRTPARGEGIRPFVPSSMAPSGGGNGGAPSSSSSSGSAGTNRGFGRFGTE